MKTLRFVFGYTKNYIKPLVITVISMLALVGVHLLVPQIIRRMVATVTDHANYHPTNGS